MAAVEFGIIGAVEMDTVAAEILGGIAGHVGTAHYLLNAATGLVDDSCADADTDSKVVFFPRETKVLNRFADSLSNLQGAIQRTVLQQYAKLIAAEARQSIAVTHLAQQINGQAAQ